jgi:hypothetical protein
MENEQENTQLPFGIHIGIVSLFVALAVIFTWPLIINLSGIPGGDSFVFTHCYWWYKKALFSLQNPFVTKYIFYPEGVNLAFQSGTFGNFLITLPVTLFAGPVVGVNISYLLTYILAAWFTFLLAYRITKDIQSSLVAAFLYSFSFMHTGHGVGHLNVSSMHCLPAVLYALYRTIELRSWGWTIVAGTFWGMTILTDQLQTIIVAGASAAVFVWCLSNRRSLGFGLCEIFYRFALILMIGLLLASPYLVAMVSFMGNGSAPLERGMFDAGGSNFFAGDLLGFVLHPRGYGLFVELFNSWLPSYGSPRQLFTGLTTIFLLFYLACSKHTNPFVGKLWIAAALSFVLSLGPTLHIGGRWQWWNDGSFIKLPYFYIAKLPLFAQIRTPDRFHISTGFAVALLVAFALISLRNFFEGRFSKKSARTIVWVIFLLLVIEYLPAVGAMHQVPTSQVLKSIASEPNNAPILWLPLSRSSSFARNGFESSVKAMYYQTIHEKPILNGLISRVSSDLLGFNSTILDSFVYAGNLDRIYSNGSIPSFEPGELDQLCLDALLKRPLWDELRNKYGFRHIIVQAPFDQEGWATNRYVECITGQTLIKEHSGGISYINLK